MDELTSVFVQESRDQLAEMEAGLLRLEQTPDDADSINAVFRAAHTIKGGAGLFGFQAVVGFTHEVESVLDRMRDGLLAVGEGEGRCACGARRGRFAAVRCRRSGGCGGGVWRVRCGGPGG